ncbi:pterin-4-alpha-carbinolamine dehydratase 2, mitochondrial [Trifolium repens]|nr:pterin-4-alpha-carbinolamine dehydratase 2, mitochondrial [Trifolium repens]
MPCRLYNIRDPVNEFNSTFKISQFPQASNFKYTVLIHKSPTQNLHNEEQNVSETGQSTKNFYLICRVRICYQGK